MRYIPHTSRDVEVMLKTIGVSSIDALFAAIPKEFQLKKPLELPSSMSEMDLRSHIEGVAEQNKAQHYGHFLGAGCYQHYIPTIVNYLASQGGFLTAYTPYQPEISQGTLQATFEFQTMMARLTGMEVSNASMYDGGTSLAEACLMAKRIQPKKRTILVPTNIHPEYREICKTYVETQDIDLQPIAYDPKTGQIDIGDLKAKAGKETLAVLVQHPNFFGALEKLSAVKKITQENDALFITVIPEPLSLALLKSPGTFGADIVVGEAQSFGNPPSFGGPHVGFFTTSKKYIRAIPGRIVGETVDAQNQKCYTLTLSTREQHIRRERATSNICTNEALLATRTAIYLSTLGEQGLKKLARWNHSQATHFSKQLKRKAPLKFQSPFFNEFVIECKRPAAQVQKDLLKEGLIGGIELEKFYPELKNCLLICTTELNTSKQIDTFCEVLG